MRNEKFNQSFFIFVFFYIFFTFSISFDYINCSAQNPLDKPKSVHFTSKLKQFQNFVYGIYFLNKPTDKPICISNILIKLINETADSPENHSSPSKVQQPKKIVVAFQSTLLIELYSLMDKLSYDVTIVTLNVLSVVLST